MRVAMLTELYAPSVGGQEMRFAELAQALRQRGHEVNVYCVGHESRLAPAEMLDGVPVRRFPIVADYRKSHVLGMPRGVLPILRYSWWCRKAVADDGHFDLYLYNQWPFGHILLAPARVRRRAVVDWCEVRWSPVYQALQRIVPRFGALNLGVSKDVAIQIGSLSGRRVEYFPSGINLHVYRCLPESRRRGLLSIGRLRPHKRLPLLIEAFARLRREGFTGSLTIAGGGPSLTEIEAALEPLEPATRDAVRLLGHVDDEEKLGLLAEAAALVITSEREGFPRVVAEAMASGLPVVTTDDRGNGTRDVVREFDLGTVTRPTAAGVADGVRAVMAEWPRHSANGLAGAKELDWDHLVSRLEDLTASLVEGAGP